jgi:trans-2,3-dihydro-3-hydroxyanthranilate isomerase
MPKYRYVTVDVFTDRRFGGNPLAVVPDARGLTDAQMQALAAEFNYSESTFVLPSEDPRHAARVRIFNRSAEMPFAGHPNVGTAYVLATESDAPRGTFVFEELAGLVEVTLDHDAAGKVRGASIRAPQALQVLAELPAHSVAECLGLAADDVDAAAHPPVVATVGVTFALVAVRGGALARCAPNVDAFRALVDATPVLDGRLSVFVYTMDGPAAARARMFAPLAGTWEDPATGSASATLAAYRLQLAKEECLELTIRQGEEMGRPSRLHASAWIAGSAVHAAVRGNCVPVFRGSFTL